MLRKAICECRHLNMKAYFNVSPGYSRAAFTSQTNTPLTDDSRDKQLFCTGTRGNATLRQL